MSLVKKERTGLSPSSFSEYQSCGRKYFYRKVAGLAPDADYDDDQSVFNIGKAFHKACEDVFHDIESLSDDHLKGIIELYQLGVDEYFPMLKAMLLAYSACHKKSGLKIIACEKEIETAYFFGIVDAVAVDSEGGWWIVDLKTAASFTPSQTPTLLSHPQLNLYAAHSPFLAQILELEIGKFKGCRYRVTTKSKLKRKNLEPEDKYIGRLSESIRSMDFSLPIERMIHRNVYQSYKQAFLEIKKGHNGNYPQNFGNCFAYYKPCQFYSQCHGKMYTEVGDVPTISNID
jgi:hypothetical protein